MNLFYSSVNKKYPSFTQAHFSDKNEILQRNFFFGGGELPLPRATTPLCRGGVCCNLTTQNTGYPFKYPTGTRVQKYPKVRALQIISVQNMVALLYHYALIATLWQNNHIMPILCNTLHWLLVFWHVLHWWQLSVSSPTCISMYWWLVISVASHYQLDWADHEDMIVPHTWCPGPRFEIDCHYINIIFLRLL